MKEYKWCFLPLGLHILNYFNKLLILYLPFTFFREYYFH